MTSDGAISRRALLRAAALSAGAAAIGGCTSGSSPAPTTSPATTPPATPTPGPSAPSAPPWSQLRQQMSGQLLLPGDPGYNLGRLSANPRYDSVHPAAVARCAGAPDVAAAVAFARDQRVPFTVRSGGHSYTGASTGTGLVIDLSAVNRVQVSAASNTVTMGAGARLVDVYAGVAAAGRGIAAGSCPTVGITGLTLGGGVGVLTRSWGLTCDSLVGYQLVTADGAVLAVDARSQPDLHWAGQGGGGGSFGVVTSLTLGTHPAPPVTLFALHWPWSAAAEVVQAWQHWGQSVDPRCWTTCKVRASPGVGGSVLVAGVWNGPATGLATALASLRASVGRPATSVSSRTHTYLDAMLTEAGCAGAGCHLPPAGTLVREPLAATSHVPATLMSAQAATTLTNAVAHAASTAGLKQVVASLDALGGAVAGHSPSSTAFVHRTAPYTVQYTATWSNPALPAAPFDAVVQGIRATMTPYLGNGAYVNYCDNSIVDWEPAYWGANYPRLQSVKRAIDPDNVFVGQQTVRE
jgi:FAD/FMN-containing dehydrogenase